MENLLVELECPICMDYLSVPIRQCATGHSVCGKCIIKLERCALCQDVFTDTRNITLEGLALKMTYPCANKDAGCTELLSYSDREKHELRCNFKGFQAPCPMRGCDFIGNVDSLKTHWLAKKSSSKIFQTFNSSSLELKNDTYFVNLVEGFGELFYYKIKNFNNTICFVVQLVGDPEEAKQYYFEVEIAKSGLHRRKITIGDYCKSMELSDIEIFSKDNCCTLAFENLSQFVVVNDYLNYTFRLARDKEEVNFSKKNNFKPVAIPEIPDEACKQLEPFTTTTTIGCSKNDTRNKGNPQKASGSKPSRAESSRGHKGKSKHGGKNREKLQQTEELVNHNLRVLNIPGLRLNLDHLVFGGNR